MFLNNAGHKVINAASADYFKNMCFLMVEFESCFKLWTIYIIVKKWVLFMGFDLFELSVALKNIIMKKDIFEQRYFSTLLLWPCFLGIFSNNFDLTFPKNVDSCFWITAASINMPMTFFFGNSGADSHTMRCLPFTI